MALAHSFYAEQAAVRGDLDEARRRRLVVLDFYGESPDDPFAVAARVVLAGEAGDPGRRPRRGRAALPSRDRRLRAARPAGHELDVPRHGRRLRRARRRLPGRDHGAGGRDRDQRVRCSGASPDRCWRASAGCCSTTARSARAEAVYQRALDVGPPRATHHGDVPRPQPAWPSLHRLHRRDDAAAAAATEALELYRAGGLRRFRNRIDPDGRPPGRRRGVLRGARRDRRRTATSRSGRRPCSGRPTPARRGRRRGPGVPARRRRPGSATGDRRPRRRRVRRRLRAGGRAPRSVADAS